MIRLCDTDGDGQVTFDEFYKLMTNPPPPLPPPPRPPKQNRRAGGTMGYAQQLNANERPRRGKDGQLQAQAQARNFRAASVEALVKRLAGGISKIKPSQIKRVYKRFQDIDTDKSGAIEYEEFMQALDMEDSAVTKQMFRVFDMDGSGSIELKEFIVVLSRFTTASKTEKLKFAFMMFDEDNSGEIERDELLDMLNATFIVEGLSNEDLEEKADSIFDFLHLPRDGAISYENFLQLAKANQGLIYPVEETKHELGGDMSINQMLEEVGN